MNYLAQLRAEGKPATLGTDKTDRSPSVSNVSSQGGRFQISSPTIALAGAPLGNGGDSGQLLALVERVAAHYRTPPDEVELMKRLALADPEAAWHTFTADLATLEPPGNP